MFGEAKKIVWGESTTFAYLDNMNEITIQKVNGELIKNLKFEFYIEKLFGGKYLGIAGEDSILFYDWEGEECIGQIDSELDNIFWDS